MRTSKGNRVKDGEMYYLPLAELATGEKGTAGNKTDDVLGETLLLLPTAAAEINEKTDSLTNSGTSSTSRLTHKYMVEYIFLLSVPNSHLLQTTMSLKLQKFHSLTRCFKLKRV
ncbi:uncharacterized protein LOC111085802 [Limulus polyphemus]|uniref:Uncharacterized protein LOC111085802 n=1 Tax=Limulus polyphemus TaxID=6850 RepID=A0ABM1SDS6_LIMPO|nr:uncharacterized protein LOC111085802 [Limulus polyphemus]